MTEERAGQAPGWPADESIEPADAESPAARAQDQWPDEDGANPNADAGLRTDTGVSGPPDGGSGPPPGR